MVGGWIASAPATAAPVPEYTVRTVPSPTPQASSNFGERLRTLADVNGDGASDVLMTASNYDGDDTNGAVLANSGRVFIFDGRTSALLRTLDPPFPQAQAKFGFWDASLGDVDGDGAGDVAISAAGQVVGGLKTGQVYIYSGRTGARLRTINAPEALTPTGAFGGDFGGNIIAPGDMTGDGIGDLVATASGAFGGAGAAYAFNGKTGAFLYKVPNPDAVQASAFGFGSAEIGDINGDGAADFQIGAPRFDEGPLVDVGRAYVINGKTGAVIYTLMDPEPEANNRFGQADADGVSLGDVNADGKPDIYVDVFLADDPPNPSSPPLPDTGKVHLFSGATGGLIRTLHDPMPEGSRQFGASNAPAGDIDLDGRPDQLISGRGSSTLRGRVTVLGGPGLSTVLKVFQDPGDAQLGALFGTGLAGPGDVNGDGRPDFYMSARGADINGMNDVGVAYAFLSVPPPAAPGPGPTPPTYPTITPPPGVTPPVQTPAVRRRGRLSARVTPPADRRAPYRFRIAGTLTRPSGVSRASGCRGRISVQVKRGGATISTKRVFLRRDCTYRVNVSFANRRRLGSTKRLKFTARFAGNAVVLPATAPSRFARVRR